MNLHCHVQVNICDAEIAYNYEYIGNCGCLCITPLTDRCYITLTQAQRLVLGGAPAGPAGTGKTESTKDLARALGVQCYVFNCSDQMDYKAMGQIYKGLAQTGAWGCFDEFNRIPVAVLSVCSTQYKTVLDAIRARKEIFLFEDVRLLLFPAHPIGLYIIAASAKYHSVHDAKYRSVHIVYSLAHVAAELVAPVPHSNTQALVFDLDFSFAHEGTFIAFAS